MIETKPLGVHGVVIDHVVINGSLDVLGQVGHDQGTLGLGG